MERLPAGVAVVELGRSGKALQLAAKGSWWMRNRVDLSGWVGVDRARICVGATEGIEALSSKTTSSALGRSDMLPRMIRVDSTPASMLCVKEQ